MKETDEDENMYDIKKIDENIPEVGWMFIIPEVEEYGNSPMRDPILLPSSRLRAEEDYRKRLREEMRQQKRADRRARRKKKRKERKR